MKTTWPVLLGLLLLAAPAAVQAQYAYSTNADGSFYAYTTNADGSANIAGYGGPPWAVIIPTNINGLLVTSIGEEAFFSCTSLANLIIPSSVTSIGANAFWDCISLTIVTIPGSVTSIGASPFAGCTSLTAISVDTNNSFYTSTNGVLFDITQSTLIQFPGGIGGSYTIANGVTSIGPGAFEKSGLTKLTIPGSVTSIGANAFWACNGLANVNIPSSVASIGTDAFAFCSSLTNLYFWGNAPSVGSSVFFSDNNATVYYLADTTGWTSTFAGLPAVPMPAFNYTTNAGAITITGYYGLPGAVFIPPTINGLPVTSIAPGAFENLSSLTALSIPGSVTNIGDNAFSGSTNLTSFYFNGNAPALGFAVFANDTNATAYYLPGTSGWSSPFAGLRAVATTAQSLFTYATNGYAITITDFTGMGRGPVIIPATFNGLPVVSIATFAFASKTGLTSVTIPGTVTNIEAEAFEFCSGLTNVSIPAGVTIIGTQAFVECYSLTSVTIPNSVTSLGAYVFLECSSLSSVNIPGSVTNFANLFEECPVASATFANGVTSIGQGALESCRTLTNITIPGSVTNIGAGAFSECTSLKAITVDTNNLFYSSVDGVLFDNSQTTLIQFPGGIGGSYTISNGVTSIGPGAFEYCGLAGITIPGSVTNIGYFPFGGCAMLKAITVATNNSFYSSLNGVLFDNSQTTLIQFPGGLGGSYTIPSSVTSIVGAAFWYCPITGVTIPGSVANIGDSAFYECANLTTITLGNGLASIGEGAFGRCTSLTSVTIPNSVTNIGDLAFYFCTKLTNVYFQGDAPTADSTVFTYDNNPTVYYLPGTTGWSNTFAGLPAVLWNPLIQTGDGSFGVSNNQFRFSITGTTNIPIVVEACANLASPVWTPLQTNTLTNGSFYFSDPQWTNFPARYYQIRAP